MALAPQPPRAIVRRIPKGGTKSLRRIRAQIKYISRDGEIDVYGSPRYGVGPLSQRDIEATLASWVRGTGHFVPGQGETNADSDLTTHLVLSFPEGADVEAARRAGLAWMNRLFNSGSESTRFDYLAALHTDTAHPHFHVAVNRRAHGDNGTWLSIANQPRPRTSQRSIGLSYTELRRTMQEEALREGIVLSDVAFPTERPLIYAPPEGLSMYPVNTLPQRAVNYDAFLGAPDVDGDDSDDESDREDEDDAGGDGRYSRPPSRSPRDDSPPLPQRRRDVDDADGAPGPSGLTAAERAEDFRVARIQTQLQGRLHPGNNAAGQTDGASGSSSLPATRGAADRGTRVRRRSIDDDGDQAAKRRRPAASVEEAGASATQPGPAAAALDPAATPAGNAAPSGGDRVESAPAGGAASITPAGGARRPDLENSPGPMGGDDGLDDFGDVSPSRSATPHAPDRNGPAATGDTANAQNAAGLEPEARSTGSPADGDANAGSPSHDRRTEAGSGQMNLFDAGAVSSANASQPAAQDGTQDQQPGASSDGNRAGRSGQAAPKRKRRTEYELLTGNEPPQPGDEPPAKRTRHQAQKAALELRSKKLLMRPFDRDRRDKGHGR